MPDKSEKIWIAIEIANDMKIKNSEIAYNICSSISKDIDIDQYSDIDTRVLVMIWVRKWNDILSSWWWYVLISSPWYSEYDIHMMNVKLWEISKDMLDWLD